MSRSAPPADPSAADPPAFDPSAADPPSVDRPLALELLSPQLQQSYAAWLARALELARAAAGAGEVPVGALLVDADGQVIAEAANAREATGDPTAHAEVLALRAGARHTGAWRMPGSTLVATLEPCVMCAGAIVAARVQTLVFGAWDPKAGACGSVWDLVRDRRANHRVEVIGGLDQDGCGEVLREFFRRRR